MLTHWPGYERSRANVIKMTRHELLALLDGLAGRPPDWHRMTDAEVLAEALRQHSEDWTIPAYERQRYQQEIRG